MKTEIWKDVIGYEGLYQVSNLGNVKTIPRNGTKKTESLLKGSCNGYGYLKVVLSNKNKKTKYIHILVAESFLGYKANKGIVCVDHINGIKIDNKLENLKIITPRENVSKDNRSNTKITGVYKVRNKYRSIINIKNNSFHLGYFNSIEEAKNAYDLKLKEINNAK